MHDPQLAVPLFVLFWQRCLANTHAAMTTHEGCSLATSAHPLFLHHGLASQNFRRASADSTGYVLSSIGSHQKFTTKHPVAFSGHLYVTSHIRNAMASPALTLARVLSVIGTQRPNVYFASSNPAKTVLSWSTEIAKPNASACLPTFQVFIPRTSPRSDSNGPPLFPELIGASVCKYEMPPM